MVARKEDKTVTRNEWLFLDSATGARMARHSDHEQYSSRSDRHFWSQSSREGKRRVLEGALNTESISDSGPPMAGHGTGSGSAWRK